MPDKMSLLVAVIGDCFILVNRLWQKVIPARSCWRLFNNRWEFHEEFCTFVYYLISKSLPNRIIPIIPSQSFSEYDYVTNLLRFLRSELFAVKRRRQMLKLA
jgi:hypothetical protein